MTNNHGITEIGTAENGNLRKFPLVPNTLRVRPLLAEGRARYGGFEFTNRLLDIESPIRASRNGAMWRNHFQTPRWWAEKGVVLPGRVGTGLGRAVAVARRSFRKHKAKPTAKRARRKRAAETPGGNQSGEVLVDVPGNYNRKLLSICLSETTRWSTCFSEDQARLTADELIRVPITRERSRMRRPVLHCVRRLGQLGRRKQNVRCRWWRERSYRKALRAGQWDFGSLLANARHPKLRAGECAVRSIDEVCGLSSTECTNDDGDWAGDLGNLALGRIFQQLQTAKKTQSTSGDSNASFLTKPSLFLPKTAGG